MADLQAPALPPVPYSKLRMLSRACGYLVMLVGFLVMLGWIFDITFLKSLRRDTVPMNPIAALGFIMAGLALLLVQEDRWSKTWKKARLIAYFLLLIGVLKLVSFFTGLSIPFDQWLFRKQLWDPMLQHYDSIAPNTALNFLLTGLALLCINYETRKGRRPSQYISIIVTLLALLTLYGYLYGIATLYSVKTHIPMAIHSGFCFLLLGVGMLFARPDKGGMAIIIGENSGQIIFMRFIAFLMPLLYGWLKIKGEDAGMFSKEFGTALFAILTYVVSLFFLARQSILQHKIRETRRQAMDVIKENERRLQAILDHSATNISLKTLLGKYTLVNKQFEKDFNREAERIIGKTDYDLFPKALARELNQYDHQIIRTGEPKSFEEKYPQEDGIHTYITVKFPLFNKERKIYALGAVSTDITKRKHLEEELRKSHQRLFSILDNVGEGVIVVDKEGNLLIFNRQAEEILGTGAVNAPLETWNKTYGFYQADGQTYFSLEDNPLFKAMKGETADNVEMLVKNRFFREEKWIAVTGRPVKDVQNEVIAGVIVFREITMRKQLEKRFTENEKRLRLILASIGEGVIIVNTDEQILVFNKKAEELLGTGPRDVPAQDWPQYYGIFEADSTVFFKAENLPLARALQGQTLEEVEVTIRNEKQPEGKHISISGKPIKDSSGRITGAILDLKDITEQRKLEEYLKEIEDQFYELLNLQRPMH